MDKTHLPSVWFTLIQAAGERTAGTQPCLSSARPTAATESLQQNWPQPPSHIRTPFLIVIYVYLFIYILCS